MATWGIVPRRAVNKTRSLRPSIIISVPSFIGIQTQPLALRIAGSKHSKFSSTNLFNFLRPSLSPEMVWLPPSSPSSSSVLTLEEEEDEEEDNISFIFIEQSRITHRLSPLSLFAWYPLILFKSLGLGGWKHVKILWITILSLQVYCITRSTRKRARDLRGAAPWTHVIHSLLIHPTIRLWSSHWWFWFYFI